MKFSVKGFSYLSLSTLSCYLTLSSLAFAGYVPAQKPTAIFNHSSGYTSTQVGIYENKHRYDYKGAVPLTKCNHFKLLGALGGAQLNAGNSSLGVTSSETDRLVQTNSNSWDTLATQLGVGYIYYFQRGKLYSDKAQWFPSVEPQLNLYYLASNSIQGDVWRFNSPDFNQLTYDIPVHSTRLMLDAALTIVSKKRFSIYAIGGIGNAWTEVSYSDQDKGIVPCVNQRLDLNSKTNSNFVWEVGAGVNYAFNERVGVSLQYMYTDLGSVKFSANGSTGTITFPIIVPSNFNLSSQTVSLGFNIALG